MRRTIARLGLLLLAAGAGAARAEIRVLANAGWFQPSDSIFRDVYGGGSFLGADVVVGLGGRLSAWAGASLYSKTGKITVTLERTTLRLAPVYGGVRYELLGGTIRPYVGAAVGYFTYKEENDIGTVSGGSVGGLGQVGVAYRPASGFRAEVFARYCSCSAKPADVTAQIGGLRGGVAVGWAF